LSNIGKIITKGLDGTGVTIVDRELKTLQIVFHPQTFRIQNLSQSVRVTVQSVVKLLFVQTCTTASPQK
jgi:hypothetical protein